MVQQLNTQYADIPRSALAGAQAGTLMQRNALLQEDQTMKRQEYGNKRKDEAQQEAALMFGSLSKMPPEQQATEYPALAQHLQSKYSDVPEFSQLPPTMTPEVKSKLSMWSGAMERTAALKRQPIAPKLENIQVGDQNVPVLLTGEGMSQIGPGGPKWPPQERSAMTSSALTQEMIDLRTRKNLNETLSPQEEAKLKSYETEKGLGAVARANAMYEGTVPFNEWPQEEKETAFEQNLYGAKPDFGSGFAATRPKMQFTKEYNQWLNKVGLTGKEAVAQQSEYKGDVQSLVSATKNLDAIKGFAKGASESFNIITDLQKAWGNGEFPRVNKWSQLFAYETGDPRVKALQNAVTTSMLEYMKVTTAGTGVSSAELSVGAQQRALELIKSSDTPETMIQAIATMRREMAVIEKARQEQKDEILGRIKTSNVPSKATPQAGGYAPDQKAAALQELRRRGKIP